MIPPYGRQHRLPEEAPVAYSFAFCPTVRLPLALLRVRPATSRILVDADRLDVRFGPWRVRTPLANVARAEHLGTPSPWRLLGVRLALPGLGLTFGSDPLGAVRIRFRQPVPGLEPSGLVRHPWLTVTVEAPEALVARLDDLRGVLPGTDRSAGA